MIIHGSYRFNIFARPLEPFFTLPNDQNISVVLGSVGTLLVIKKSFLYGALFYILSLEAHIWKHLYTSITVVVVVVVVFAFFFSISPMAIYPMTNTSTKKYHSLKLQEKEFSQILRIP